MGAEAGEGGDRGARLHLPPLDFGRGAIDGLFQRVGVDEAQTTIPAALAGGLCHFDTAPRYRPGPSKRRIGDAVRARPDILIFTKVGRFMVADASITDDCERNGFSSAVPFSPRYDYTADGILRSCEASLHRLGLACVGLLLVHDICGMDHDERHDHYRDQLTCSGGLAALERLRSEGAIDGFGIGVKEIDVCLGAIRAASLDVILLAGHDTLSEQEPLGALFSACIAAGVRVIVGGSYNSGILVADMAGEGRCDCGKTLATIVDRVRHMVAIAKAHDAPLAAAALPFPLAYPAVTCVIAGLRNPEDVRQTLGWFDRPIPDVFWVTLRGEGLLRMDAPLPQDRH